MIRAETEYIIITELNPESEELLKLKIDAEKKIIKLILNAKLLYTLIYNRELIVGAINCEINKLLKIYLENASEKEIKQKSEVKK